MKGSVFPYKTELQTYLQSFNSSFDLPASWDNRFKQVDRILKPNDTSWHYLRDFHKWKADKACQYHLQSFVYLSFPTFNTLRNIFRNNSC